MKYCKNVKTKEQKEKEVKDAFESINEGVLNVFNSDKYKEFLESMKNFNNYSLNNMLLILFQKPEASMVCSYTKWKELGRQVKKGEKGLSILAPCPHKFQKEITEYNENGEEVKTQKNIEYLSFTIKKCFDISQTEGDPIPQICNELQGEDVRAKAIISTIKDLCDWQINYKNKKDMGDSFGYCNYLTQEIAIKKGISEIQEAKTLIHEYAHKLLHNSELIKDKSRDNREIEAESIAFVISDYFGLDTSNYSFEYVASWSQDKSPEELRLVLNNIQNTALELIEDLEPKIINYLENKK